MSISRLTVGQPSASLLRWVPTCRLPITNRRKSAPDHFRLADKPSRIGKEAFLICLISHHELTSGSDAPEGVEIMVFADVFILLRDRYTSGSEQLFVLLAPKEIDSNPVIASFQTAGLGVEVNSRRSPGISISANLWMRQC